MQSHLKCRELSKSIQRQKQLSVKFFLANLDHYLQPVADLSLIFNMHLRITYRDLAEILSD